MHSCILHPGVASQCPAVDELLNIVKKINMAYRRIVLNAANGCARGV